MQFKIDTKETFTILAPQTALFDAQVAAKLAETCADLRRNGSANFIFDMGEVAQITPDAVTALIALHETLYAENQSLVITGTVSAVMAEFKQDEVDLLLNIAPKMAEAIDIISMEILERELLGEE
jgi:anti-anti-sigma regulatory factor